VSELGYHEPVPGIYGTANPATDSDPVSRAALQEATAAQMRTFTTKPGYVPPSYQGDAIGPTYTQLGNGALPRIGWTCQKDAGTPVFAPYDGSHIGRIPDWTSDANAIGAGSDDMNEVFTGAFPPNRLGVAPVGDGLLQFDDQRTNPNAPTTDVSGTIDLEY
jgi:hypothetical protein